MFPGLWSAPYVLKEILKTSQRLKSPTALFKKCGVESAIWCSPTLRAPGPCVRSRTSHPGSTHKEIGLENIDAANSISLPQVDVLEPAVRLIQTASPRRHLRSVFFLVHIPILLGAPASANSVPRYSSSTIPELQRIVQTQEAAWNNGNARAWGSVFCEDATFVNIRGKLYQGRTAIIQFHLQILEGPYKGSHTTMSIRRITQLGDGIALIETDNEVSGFQALPPGVVATSAGILRTRLRCIARKQGGGRKIISTQNTAILPVHAGVN